MNIEDLKKIYKQDPTQLYDSVFFRKRTTKMRNWETQLGHDLSKRYSLNSIVDFGCGIGSFIEGALNGGCSIIKGYDISYDKAKHYIPECVAGYIEYGNVGKLIDCGTFDCSLSIEVAEHILPEESDIFVENMTRSALKIIILTAAPPGQSGTGHINCQPQTYWIDKFFDLGWGIDKTNLRDTKKSWTNIINTTFPKKNGPMHVVDNLLFFRPL